MKQFNSQNGLAHRTLCWMIGLLIFLSLSGLGRLQAQEVTGSISGTVQDRSGAVIPNATIVAKRMESQSRFSTTTNSLGLYSFPALPIGTYQITAQAQGFQKYVGSGLKMNVNDHLQLDITLQVGSMTESVEVAAQPTAVNTESSTVGELVNGDQVQELPLNGRNFIALTTLVPGTAPGGAGGLDTFDVGLVGGASLSINGNASNGNLWLVNGVNNLDIGSNRTLLVFPSVDSISEFTILRNNYSAEFGYAAGGIVNVVTKSGAQSFHGDVFEFLRNDRLDATDPILQAKNKLRYNNYGWTLGGPFFIPNHYNTDKTKDFFFFSQEWRRQVRGGTVTMNVPSSRQRAGILDPSCSNPNSPSPCVPQPPDRQEIAAITPGSNPPMVEPNEGPYCLSGVTAPCIVAPGQSPAPGTTPIQFDPNAEAELARYPLPNTVSTAGSPNLIASKPASTKWREESARWDHAFNEKTTLWLNWIHDTWAQENTNALWGDAANPTIGSDWSQPSNVATAHLVRTWNSRMLSSFQFNYSDNFIDWLSAKSCPASLCSRQGFTYKEIFPETNGQFPTLWGTGDGFSTLWHVPPYNNRTDILQWSGDFDYVFGKHTLKTGAGALRLRKPAPSVAWNPTAGDLFAGNLHDFLLGQVAEYDETKSQNLVPTRWNNGAVYVQDTYKLFSNLTLNLGLRWQVLGQPYSATNNISNFYPNLWNPAQAPTLIPSGEVIQGTGNPLNGLVSPQSPGVNRSLVDNHYKDWEPRLGFAYDPFRHGQFVLRGGFGIYHAQDSVDHLVNIGGNPPQNASVTLVNTSFSAIGPPPPGSPQGAVSLVALDRNRRNPASYQYSFGFQYALPSDTTLELNYVGSHETDLGRNRDINQVPSSAQLAVFNGMSSTLFRPFVGYDIIMLNERAGFARYNSLQLFVNHRLRHGLQVQGAYTFAHSISDSSNEQNGANANPVQDAFHPERDKSWSNIDQPQALVINYIWDIPLFRGQTGFKGQTLGGWQLSGVNSFSSGLPASACLLSDNAGLGAEFLSNGCERPNLVASPNLGSGSRTVARYFNTSAFILPPTGTFGDAAKNVIRLPGINNWDFAVSKKFRTPWLGGALFDQSGGLQFTAQFFNVWNHTQFSGLDTSFGDPGFGRLTSVRLPREIQFGLKFMW